MYREASGSAAKEFLNLNERFQFSKLFRGAGLTAKRPLVIKGANKLSVAIPCVYKDVFSILSLLTKTIWNLDILSRFQTDGSR